MDKPLWLFGLCVYLHAPMLSEAVRQSSNRAPFLRPFDAAGALCIHISVSLRNGASERRCLYTNMDLLVAGLQGVDSYGLYQYW